VSQPSLAVWIQTVHRTCTSLCLWPVIRKHLSKVPIRFIDGVRLKSSAGVLSVRMEGRAVGRFLAITKPSAKGIKAELEEVYAHEALCLSTVRKWRRFFVNGRIPLKDSQRSEKRRQSDLSESGHALTAESPLISCKRTCQKLRIAKTTCLGVLHESLSSRKCYSRRAPHVMTENEAQCRTVFAEELLQVVRHTKETNCDN
jgi:hypothetical protein